MYKILLTDSENYRKKVDLVRYFKFKSDYFLIYTMGETDEKDYVKLYLVKIMEELGVPISLNIKDETEWKGMQDIVKKVIKEVKSDKKKLVEDLDPKEIEGIKIESARFFKLDEKLVSVLASNYIFDQNEFDNSTNVQLDEKLNKEITNKANLNDEISYDEFEDTSQYNEINPIRIGMEDINYKALYIAVKEEKEAVDVLLQDMVAELLNYKEKFGDIERD